MFSSQHVRKVTNAQSVIGDMFKSPTDICVYCHLKSPSSQNLSFLLPPTVECLTSLCRMMYVQSLTLDGGFHKCTFFFVLSENLIGERWDKTWRTFICSGLFVCLSTLCAACLDIDFFLSYHFYGGSFIWTVSESKANCVMCVKYFHTIPKLTVS